MMISILLLRGVKGGTIGPILDLGNACSYKWNNINRWQLSEHDG